MKKKEKLKRVINLNSGGSEPALKFNLSLNKETIANLNSSILDLSYLEQTTSTKKKPCTQKKCPKCSKIIDDDTNGDIQW